jgi:hypothetical protein
MSSEAELYEAALAQFNLAKDGRPLVSFSSELVLPTLLQPAINTREAYLKSAYWLATAARLSYGAGRNGTVLLPLIQDYLGKGDPGWVNRTLGISSWFSGEEANPRLVGEIFQNAASAANQAGVANVAQRLQQLGMTEVIDKRQIELGKNPLTFGERVQDFITLGAYSKIKNNAVGIAISGTILLVVGGVLAYLYRTQIKGASKGVVKTGISAAQLLL